MMENNAQGVILVRANLRCGRCNTLYHPLTTTVSLASFPTITSIKRTLRNDGWRETKQYGWVCPECVQKYKPLGAQ